MRLLAGIALLAAGALFAQSTGAIHLEVKDPSGAGMKAVGRLKSSTGFNRPFRTDAAGACAFDNLPFGDYQLEMTAPGFIPETVTIHLQSASVTQTVVMAVNTGRYAVEVIGVTPLPGVDLPANAIPAPVQNVNSRDLTDSGALDLADLLNRRLNSVYINENQGNPFQPDVNYRGYTASPLLGTPEGLSVYVDGVRQNQPFGDIVAWDLIPKIAIEETELMPGSNPLFGLNTLGGAVSIQTKDGQSHPGASFELTGGMYGRRAAQGEYGGASARTGMNWYFAGNLFREDGWRVDSPSEVRQAFSKFGWQHAGTALGLSLAYADNWLTGNGLMDARFIAQSYSSVYSVPDITWNRSPSLNLTLRHDSSSRLVFSGNAYFRYIRSDTDNADINSSSFDQPLYNLSAADTASLTAAGYSGFPTTGNAATEPFPHWLCIAQALEKADPSDSCDGIITRTYTKQNNYGASGQASWAPNRHHVTLGFAWDGSSMTFQQASQFGYLNADRITITPVNAFANGSTSSDGLPVDTRVDLRGLIRTASLFASDSISVTKQWVFTVSGRYNRTTIDNTDRLPPAPDGSRGSLTGDYAFGRLNPAAGVTYSPSSLVTLYFSYSESSRAPTAIELGCANPEFPCNLPNALVSDPPLKQVVARTVEAGVRGGGEGPIRWSAGWFRGENYNDLLFVASQQTGFGYFTNFGQTRRTGVETNLSGRAGHFMLGGGYTFLNATYQSAESINGGSNSANDAGQGMDGDIAIQPGDRIPEIPQHVLKAYGEWQATGKLAADLDFVAVSSSYARGNENNLDKPDGVYYFGPGTTPGYGVVNLGARYQLRKKLQLFAQVNNLLDHRYYTAGQLAPTPFNDSYQFAAQPFAAVNGNYPVRSALFAAPGAPITVFGGIRIRF